MDFAGKAALVTGGSNGIGRGDLVRLAEPAQQVLGSRDAPRRLHVAKALDEALSSTAPDDKYRRTRSEPRESVAIALAS